METDADALGDTIAEAFAIAPARIVDTSIELLQILASSLSTVVGESGFESLLNRAICRVNLNYNWLQLDASAHSADPEFEHLRQIFLVRSLADVRAASIELIATIVEIVASLIGGHLTTLIVSAALDRAGRITKEQHDG